MNLLHRLVMLLLVLTATAAALVDEEVWRIQVSEHGGFQVMLPEFQRSEWRSRTFPVNQQTASVHLAVGVRADNTGFVWGGVRVPPQLDRVSDDVFFKQIRAAMEADGEFKIETGKRIRTNGKPGIECQLRHTSGERGLIRYYRPAQGHVAFIGAFGPRIDASHPVAVKALDSIVFGDVKKSPQLADFNADKIADPRQMKGLIAYWGFDSSEQTGAAEHTSTLSNAHIGEGIRGVGVVFPQRQSHVKLTQPAQIKFKAGQPYSVACWFKKSSERFQSDPLMSLRSSEKEGGLIHLKFGGLGIGASIRCDGSTQPLSLTSKIRPENDKWYHVAVTRDAEGVHRIFVNGTQYDQVGGKPYAGPITANMNSLAVDLMFSGRPMQPSFQGTIDEVVVFDRVLEPEELAALAGRVK